MVLPPVGPNVQYVASTFATQLLILPLLLQGYKKHGPNVSAFLMMFCCVGILWEQNSVNRCIINLAEITPILQHSLYRKHRFLHAKGKWGVTSFCAGGVGGDCAGVTWVLNYKTTWNVKSSKFFWRMHMSFTM
jgi:hypothetical protein